jgi:ABC-2 type transport system ATP-binding protein
MTAPSRPAASTGALASGVDPAPASRAFPLARLRQAHKRYGAVEALRGVDLAIARGELVALLGPNGAGKTTAVKLLLGLARPSAGEARVLGRDPRDAATRRGVGAMLQIAKVPETLTVREHLESFRSYYPRPLPLGRLVEIAGLQGLEKRKYGELSGGQQRRTLLALALCGDPELLLLDEPTVGLDVEARRALWKEIRQLVAAGRSVLLTTHYLEEADALADRVVVLVGGRVVADDTPAAIKARFAGRRVRCRTRLTAAELRALPGAQGAELDGGRAEIVCGAAEPVVAALLQRDPGIAELEVTSAALDDAFLALTREGIDHDRTAAAGGSR